MKDFFYNLQGGINTAKTQVALGSDVKKLCWDDSYNVEILKNQGICRQSGNALFLQLKDKEKIVGLFEYPKNTDNFVFVTESAKIYYWDGVLNASRLVSSLDKPVFAVAFAHYLNGIIVCSDANGGVYIEIGAKKEVSPLNLKKADESDVCATTLCVYAGRVWVGSGATLYFSALGRFDDWTSSEDAGYIEQFHCSTSKIIALKEYTACMAVYKEDGVWLLSGTSPEAFVITRFADKGTFSQNSVLVCDNKQYFVSRSGVFALEQAGDLSQICLSKNIAANIQTYFEKIDHKKTPQSLMLSDEIKNQIWIFLPFSGSEHLNEILIYNYYCDAWFRRVIPYEITCAASVFGKIYTASAQGEIFVENKGNTFASKPIEFRLSTPFFNLGSPSTRKIIEDMNFIFDESRENRFKFAVSKDYLSSERFDVELIDTVQPNCLVWQASNGELDRFDSVWSDSEQDIFCWAEPLEEAYKTDIFDSNTAVQLHIESDRPGDDFAIVGIEFREIVLDE